MPQLIQLNDATRPAELGQLNQWLLDANQQLASLRREVDALSRLVSKVTLKVDEIERLMRTV